MLLKTFKLILLVNILTGCASTANQIVTRPLIYQVNSYGEPQPHKGMYTIENGTVYKTDSVGNIQYHKPVVKIQK